MAYIGYYRVPVGAVLPSAQEKQLLAHGCGEIYLDTCSPLAVVRPGLDAAFSHLKALDCLVVPDFHALAGTLVDLLAVFERLWAADHHLVSLTEGVDTIADPAFFGAMNAMRSFNDDRVVRRKVEAKISDAAKSVGGRPPLVDDETWGRVLPRLWITGPDRLTIVSAAELLGVSCDTVRRKVRATRV